MTAIIAGLVAGFLAVVLPPALRLAWFEVGWWLERRRWAKDHEARIGRLLNARRDQWA